MRGCRILFVLFACLVINPLQIFPQSENERKSYLKDILHISIPQRFQANTRRVTCKDSTWADWLHRSGELPPDFSAMAHHPFLPEPLLLEKNGKEYPVTTKEQWNEKREWIKKQYEHWVSGMAPPAPKELKVNIVSDSIEDGTRIQLIELRFGPAYQARMTLELMIPANEKELLPVYMTQWTHRGWAQLAVRRGYIGCVYAAADDKDDTQAYQSLYPDYDFSMLMRRAWGASRVVDYLFTRPEVNKKQIAITGHSRNGKQSLWAAAFDERIAAVISSSSSTGGDAPWRYGDPQYASETLDYVTALNGHWFHPRLRFFFGREDQLPVDQNLLNALIAPRPLLFHYSLVERGLNSWANEQNYQSVKKVYDFLDVPNNIGVLARMGEHAVAARDVEKSIDFLDVHFKRRKITWQTRLYFTYNFDSWLKEHPAELAASKKISSMYLKNQYSGIKDFTVDRTKIIENLQWLLGDKPPGVKAAPAAPANPLRYDWIDNTIGRPKVPGTKTIYLGPYTAIGDHISGILYCPADKSGKLRVPGNGKMPVVIYLHQYAYSTGYAKGYSKNGGNGNSQLFKELVDKGFAVLAIDMFGFGTRIEEATNFYERFPGWSKMGKMVNDVKGCVDALESLNYIDKKNIFLLGNTIGGSIALMASALDPRIAGTAVVAAFSPWRSSNSRYESIRSYSHLHGFIPRLGLFAEKAADAPVDYCEIIAAAAPKPLLVITPDMDRYADVPAIKETMQRVAGIYNLYGKAGSLMTGYPHEINRMTEEMYASVAEFFHSMLNAK